MNATNGTGNTALMVAASNCDLKIASLLLKYGSRISITNSKGDTALSLACNDDMKKLLSSK